MFFPTEHERNESRDRTNPGASRRSRTRTDPEGVLRSDKTHADHGSLLRRQLERHPEEVQEHGCQIMRLPLASSTHPRRQVLAFCKS